MSHVSKLAATKYYADNQVFKGTNARGWPDFDFQVFPLCAVRAIAKDEELENSLFPLSNVLSLDVLSKAGMPAFDRERRQSDFLSSGYT
jgi:hypothetical protein